MTIGTLAHLDDVAPETWDLLARPAGFYVSHGWLRAVHDDAGVEARYVTVVRGGELVGALPVFDVAAEGNDFYAPRHHHGQLTGAGHWLLAGTRRGYHNGLLARERPVVEELVSAALREAADRGARGLVWRFVPTPMAAVLHELGASVAFDTVDATVTAGSWEEYLDGLSADRRRTTLRERRRFETAGYQLSEVSLGDSWEQLAGLVANVQQKYGHGTTAEQMRGVLGRQLAHLDDRSVTFALERDGVPVGAALAYRFGDTLYSRMVGFDYPRLAGAYEYFNLIFNEPIHHMQRHRLRHLHLGIEAEETKVLHGARLHPLWTVAMPVGGGRLAPPTPARDHVAEWRGRFGAPALPPEHWDVPW